MVYQTGPSIFTKRTLLDGGEKSPTHTQMECLDDVWCVIYVIYHISKNKISIDDGGFMHHCPFSHWVGWFQETESASQNVLVWDSSSNQLRERATGHCSTGPLRCTGAETESPKLPRDERCDLKIRWSHSIICPIRKWASIEHIEPISIHRAHQNLIGGNVGYISYIPIIYPL